MKLNDIFNHQEFIDWISVFLPDFTIEVRKVDIPKGFQGIKAIQTIGESSLGVRVYIIETEQDPSRRKIGLATESFTLLRDYGTPNAIVVYYSQNSPLWRLSLLTSSLSWDEDKIKKNLSNPKRYSFVLGVGSKLHTPSTFLIKQGSIATINELKNRFSLEVVNSQFYTSVAQLYIKLVGGSISNGTKTVNYLRQLNLHQKKPHDLWTQEFAVRLIGRLIFCWFLKEIKSKNGTALIPPELLSTNAVYKNKNYYTTILEPLFFEVLNRPLEERQDDKFYTHPYDKIPYLNGGLFQNQPDDFYKYYPLYHASEERNVSITDEWFIELFGILEQYNFTVDENTSVDVDLSIDPEMLGRIFENLLAEVNPATGNSARKSTGSFYTPRVLVEYMVDKSLILYLHQKTGITQTKLKALTSYNISDDLDFTFGNEEKSLILEALYQVTILDPACGSGAFPIGALQKIVYILEQIDPHAEVWFQKQIQQVSPEFRRHLQQELADQNFNYIRKLGIIRQSIFGVDIQPIAVEIARLRCFLTLIVEQKVEDDRPNRGIRSLPNLNFKFVAADSLIGLPKIDDQSKSPQTTMYDDTVNINKLKEIRNQYFVASGSERFRLEKEFAEQQHSMMDELVKAHGYIGLEKAEVTTKLKNWKPFSHIPASWFDTEWMFGIEEGFDIVIANPPYGISLKGEKRKEILKYYPKVPDFEIFYFFIEHAAKNLKPGGILSYIVPNTLLFNVFAKEFRRKLLSNYSIKIILDCTSIRLFEHATVRNCVLILTKGKTNNTIGYINPSNVNSTEELLNRGILTTSAERLEQYIPNWGLVFKLEEEVLDLISKISLFPQLNKFYTEVSQGLIAYDKYQGQSEHIIKTRAYHHEENLSGKYKKWLQGEDVKRYSVKWNGVKYIDYCKEIANPRLPKFFRGPRVLIREITNPSILAACTEEELYNDPSVLIIKEANDYSCEFLVGILNSKLATFYHFNSSPKATKGDFPKILIKDINEFPLSIGNHKQRHEVEELVKEAQRITYDEHGEKKSANLAVIENRINKIIYSLYGLTNTEVKLIENSVKMY